MEAEIVGLAGPLEGAVFRVDKEISIGREKTNSVAIEDRVLSRRHCQISSDGGKFQIRDLGSSNGTYVNGLPITSRELQDGDQIKAGQSLFLFAQARRDAPILDFEATTLSAAATIVLKAEDAVYLHPHQLPKSDRTMRNLEVLLKAGPAIASIRGLDRLQQKLLQLILEVIPAERGAILLAGKGTEEFASLYEWGPGGSAAPMRISRNMVERVMKDGVALLSNDIMQDPSILVTDTMVTAQLRSFMAIPLIAFDRTLGAICLISRNPANVFEAEHLELLTGIAGIAAVALENALFLQNLQQENDRLRVRANIEHDLVGNSPRMQQVFLFIAKAAPTGSTVLIRGESGTGKELVARAIHRNSPRAARPFVAINCAALTETLLESELFGHERGAFTGAIAQKKGKLEEASGGTVFLDEVGELAPPLQAKLLRVLQEREFERVGGTRTVKTDIRLIAATNRDLEEAVRAGGFRRDLYYRLNVVSIILPPLRDRREDILALANYLVLKHMRNSTRQVIGISEEARAYLVHYDWPGNVRELENALERAVVLGSTEWILREDLPENVVEADLPESSGADGFHELVCEAKREIVVRAMEQAGGNYCEAAARLRLHPSNLHRLIRTLNLRGALKK